MCTLGPVGITVNLSQAVLAGFEQTIFSTELARLLFDKDAEESGRRPQYTIVMVPRGLDTLVVWWS